MDDRGRLAQPLESVPARIPFDVSFAGRFGRAQRAARRALAPILDLKLPQGIGSLAVGALLLGTVAYGCVRGGHLPAMAEELHNTCDAVAGRAGLGISSIALSGAERLGRDDILGAAAITPHSSLLCLDAASARARLAANPWISEATVLKLYPGRLRIEVVEREAVALWQRDGQVSVISADGTVLEPFTGTRFAELPLVVGAGAQAKARDFLALVGRYPILRDAVEASVLVADRRWNLRLKSGIDVRLPENDIDAALQTLVQLDRDKKLLSRDITVVDLRLPDRVTVRLSDNAAQAREEALKELLKKKAKPKGTDA